MTRKAEYQVKNGILSAWISVNLRLTCFFFVATLCPLWFRFSGGLLFSGALAFFGLLRLSILAGMLAGETGLKLLDLFLDFGWDVVKNSF